MCTGTMIQSCCHPIHIDFTEATESEMGSETGYHCELQACNIFCYYQYISYQHCFCTLGPNHLIPPGNKKCETIHQNVFSAQSAPNHMNERQTEKATATDRRGRKG